MKYVYSSSDQRALGSIKCALLAAGINVAIIVAMNGFSTTLDRAFSSVNSLFESVCTRFC